jgi:hypothetical protein
LKFFFSLSEVANKRNKEGREQTNFFSEFVSSRKYGKGAWIKGNNFQINTENFHTTTSDEKGIDKPQFQFKRTPRQQQFTRATSQKKK